MSLRKRSAVAARPATVDLFAQVSSPGSGCIPPVTPFPSMAPRLVAPATRRPQAAPLWYAVVFPELTEPEAPATLRRLGACALQFTSLVSLEMPNALLLEIKGSVTLFGSLTHLHERMDAAWRELGLRAQGAIAPAALAALWCARAGKRACTEDPGSLTGELAPLPLTCTAWDVERLETLRAMGVTRVGDLLRLPRAGLARRLGPAAVLDLDVALGRQAAPRRAFVPRERFRERCDFEAEIDTVTYLQKALEPLVLRCASFLRERQAGVQALELRLRHGAKPMTRVRVGLASITSERRRLADVLEERLHRLELHAPVRGMELLSGSLRPLSAASMDAFAGGMNTSEAVPHLVERLRARLGETAVYGVVCVPEHRPEAAWRRVQELSLSVAGAQGAAQGGVRPTGVQPTGVRPTGIPPTGVRPAGIHATGVRATAVRATGVRSLDVRDEVPRPVWLLERPLPLSTDLQPIPDGGLILEEGPERIESGWWDGGDVTRDYYIARCVQGGPHAQGARWWVFQERRSKSWYLHGVFA